MFRLRSDFEPKGDQPQAIELLVDSLRAGNKNQTLWGVTGSGKTFTMANIIQALQRPTLIISHNKTLAAQLYAEFKSFFPDNAVEYFVSYYDYYQPEAYIPKTDTFIEKDASINEEIDRLRISASSALISRKDVIVVASVSCIYGLGSPDDFTELMIPLHVGKEVVRDTLLGRLVENRYERDDSNLTRGKFRVRGEIVDVMPAYMETGVRIEFWGDKIVSLQEYDPESGEYGALMESFNIYPANQYITRRDKLELAIEKIKAELDVRVHELEKSNRLIEAQRIRMRTEYDLELLREMGFCSGIENYSMHLSGRVVGDRPFCLMDFFPQDMLVIVDESHVTLPQVGAMYVGDRVRKQRLVDYGFRLPSATENRPLKPEEFWSLAKQALFVSATPGKYEFGVSSVVAEQLIRPTGLLDPLIEIRPIKGQVENLVGEIHQAIAAGERILVTTLTKRMTEDISIYLRRLGIKVEYLHSDIGALERVEILRHLRQGKFDVLVGVNLLREGLDLPEVALVAVLDADKEGFLRSETSLIQTAGRAARHEKGRVILYADRITGSINKLLEISKYRREKQEAYNTEHGIVPRGVRRKIEGSMSIDREVERDPICIQDAGGDVDKAGVIAQLESEMLEAASELNFEQAAVIRDQIDSLRSGKQAPKQRSRFKK